MNAFTEPLPSNDMGDTHTKVRLKRVKSLFLIKHHAMKMCGGVEVQLYHFQPRH